jgi:hypothetical protein
MLKLHSKYKITMSDYIIGGITSVVYIGKLIDDFLAADKDIWILDYIVIAIF